MCCLFFVDVCRALGVVVDRACMFGVCCCLQLPVEVGVVGMRCCWSLLVVFCLLFVGCWCCCRLVLNLIAGVCCLMLLSVLFVLLRVGVCVFFCFFVAVVVVVVVCVGSRCGLLCVVISVRLLYILRKCVSFLYAVICRCYVVMLCPQFFG